MIKRKPELSYNTRFLDCAKHYGFSIYACNPGKPNEKGRVERVIRDMENFLKVWTFTDIEDLNRKFGVWRTARNKREHRTTGRSPVEMLTEEKLKPLPQIPYKAYRHEPSAISKTGFITFETNRYSVPSDYSGRVCDLMVYPRQIEIIAGDRKIAVHTRLFIKKQKVEHPMHRQKLLKITPLYKQQRTYQLMKGMDKALEHFLNSAQQQGQDPLLWSYELFKLLRGTARETLISAVKTANSLSTYKITYVQSLLRPLGYQDNPVHPQDTGLLHITYEGRRLSDYDELI